MTEAQTHPWFRPWKATTRLVVSTVVGIAVYFGLRRTGPGSPVGLIAWDAGVLCFLLLTHRVLADHSIDSMRRRAAAADTKTLVIMILVVTAACVSLYGISRNLDVMPDHPVLRVVLIG